MSLIVDEYRDGTYRAKCDKCGQIQYADEMYEPPLQSPGGGASGLLICKRHKVVYYALNDLPFLQFEDPEIAENPRIDATQDITPAIPVPVLTSISPASGTVAGLLAAPTITINGSGFSQVYPRSVARCDGITFATTFVSATQLTAVLPAGFITVGTHQIDVWNIGPPNLPADIVNTDDAGSDANPNPAPKGGNFETDLTNQNLSNQLPLVIS